MNIINILLVGVGGGLGSIARYLVSKWADRNFTSVFPYGTLTVNIVGSFLLGALLALLMKKTGLHTHEWKLFLVTGFCGGFTTFSTFAGENVTLFSQKFPATALLYIVASVAGGLLAVWAGFALSRNFF